MLPKIKKEVCLENTTYLLKVIEAGANRIELCDNLAVGGTTPSYAQIKYAREICTIYDLELGVIIRPRGGNFCYTNSEKNIILEDAIKCVELGINRLVIGFLTSSFTLDKEFIKYFINTLTTFKKKIDLANKLQSTELNITFHMAFDYLTGNLAIQEDEYILKNIFYELKDLGVDTILSHGSIDKTSIFSNVEVLRRYLTLAREFDLILMPGGGLRYKNLADFLCLIPDLSYVHGTQIVKY